MRFYLPLLLLGFAFGMQAQDPATVNLRSVAQPNQRVSIYNETAINSTASNPSLISTLRLSAQTVAFVLQSLFPSISIPRNTKGSLRLI